VPLEAATNPAKRGSSQLEHCHCCSKNADNDQTTIPANIDQSTVNLLSTNFPMQVPFVMGSARNFYITRVGEPGDPTAPLEFYPPKGSDELYEALKEAYPHHGNLQARMREAVMEFYLNEQREAEARQYFSPQLTNNTTPEYLPSPDSSFASAISTPPPAQAMSNQNAVPQSSNPPAQHDLMDVWSLPTSTQTKIHKRRNMTVEEKVKYKAKRLVGACDDCRRRRRKVRALASPKCFSSYCFSHRHPTLETISQSSFIPYAKSRRQSSYSHLPLPT
jgi:hypothetical protein